MRHLNDVYADLECGHRVMTSGLTKTKADQALAMMQLSAFCETCGGFKKTKHAWSQTRVAF